MKRIYSIVIILFLSLNYFIGIVFATYTILDSGTITKIDSKLDKFSIDNLIDLRNKLEKLILNIEDNSKNAFKKQLYNEVLTLINTKITTRTGLNSTSTSKITTTLSSEFNTQGRRWSINGIDVFEYTLDDTKKILGIDLSYQNTLDTSFNFPGNYPVVIKFKDNNGYEYAAYDINEYGTSLKGGLLDVNEKRRGYVFFIIPNDLLKGTIIFSYFENGEKVIKKDIEIPSLKNSESQNNSGTKIGLNTPFVIDGIEYEILGFKLFKKIGNDFDPQYPTNDKFLILEYSYKNIDSKYGYSGTFRLKDGEYLYDEDSTALVYSQYQLGYESLTSPLLKETKRKRYIGFDIKASTFENGVLRLEPWGIGNDDFIEIPMSNIYKGFSD